MKHPIPHNSTEALKVGDHVQIVPEWQDPGDDQYQRLVIEAPENCTRVRIQAIIPELVFQPVEWIEAEKVTLISLPTPDPSTPNPSPPNP